MLLGWGWRAFLQTCICNFRYQDRDNMQPTHRKWPISLRHLRAFRCICYTPWQQFPQDQNSKEITYQPFQPIVLLPTILSFALRNERLKSLFMTLQRTGVISAISRLMRIIYIITDLFSQVQGAVTFTCVLIL